MTAGQRLTLLLSGLLYSSTTGCADRAVPPPPQRDVAPPPSETDPHPELPSRLHLSPEVVAKAGIQTAAVTYRKLPVTVDLSGEIIADPDQSARLVARVSGRVLERRIDRQRSLEAGSHLDHPCSESRC